MPIRRLKPSSENEELIAHIKDVMGSHEEPYAAGAWENFNKEEGKVRGLIFWMGRLSSAAAVLMVGIAIYFYANQTESVIISKKAIAEHSAKIEERTKAPLNPLDVLPKEQESSANPSSKSAIDEIIINRDEEVVANVVEIKPTQTAKEPMQVEEVIAQQPVVSASPVATEASIPKKPLSLDEFLAKENKINNTAAKPEKALDQNKWDLGVVVAPSFGNTNKLNMGYGLSMAYNLNSKVSIGSGLSYNEMGATKDIIGNNAPNSPSAANALVNDTKSLESVNTKVSGIDIPLELRYNLSSRFYANVGVSAFAVINQQQNNVYLQGSVVQRSAMNPAGDQQTLSFFVTEKVSETAPEAVNQSSKLIGFYNFSFGYRQKISKGKSIGIEPFMKVPMRDVTKENLRLMGTGLKIKFDF